MSEAQVLSLKKNPKAYRLRKGKRGFPPKLGFLRFCARRKTRRYMRMLLARIMVYMCTRVSLGSARPPSAVELTGAPRVAACRVYESVRRAETCAESMGKYVHDQQPLVRIGWNINNFFKGLEAADQTRLSRLRHQLTNGINQFSSSSATSSIQEGCLTNCDLPPNHPLYIAKSSAAPLKAKQSDPSSWTPDRHNSGR